MIVRHIPHRIMAFTIDLLVFCLASCQWLNCSSLQEFLIARSYSCTQVSLNAMPPMPLIEQVDKFAVNFKDSCSFFVADII